MIIYCWTFPCTVVLWWQIGFFVDLFCADSVDKWRINKSSVCLSLTINITGLRTDRTIWESNLWNDCHPLPQHKTNTRPTDRVPMQNEGNVIIKSTADRELASIMGVNHQFTSFCSFQLILQWTWNLLLFAAVFSLYHAKYFYVLIISRVTSYYVHESESEVNTVWPGFLAQDHLFTVLLI